MENINLLGKDLKELNELCIKYDFPKFHSEQLYKWMYQKKADYTNTFCLLMKNDIKKENIKGSPTI